MKGKWFLVLLNKYADRTLLHSPPWHVLWHNMLDLTLFMEHVLL